jgi:protein SCO1/2
MFQLFGTFRSVCLALAALAIALVVAPRAHAAITPDAPIDAAGRVPDEIKNVGVTEHLGVSLPLDARFLNESGEELPLRSYFGHGRPVVLQLGYFQCPMLCTLVSKGLLDSVKQVNLKAGTDFDMLFISIDPSETPSLAALKQQSTAQYYGKPDEASGFHFLVGRPAEIQAVTSTVGFRYEEMTDTQQFAHAAVLLIVTPDGKVSRYLYGTTYPPQTVRLSLVEASAGKIGTTMDQLILICLHYDSATGKYAWAAIGLLRIAGVLTLLGLGGAMFYFFRREFHLAPALKKTSGPAPPDNGK